MDLSKLGPGRDEDAGRGLYGSQDFESARNYIGNDGQGVVLPLIVRRSELGNVIDVRQGTPLGDRWLAYVRATARGGGGQGSHPHLSRVLYPFSDSPIGVYRDGRGDRFEAFLRTLADDPALPPAIREAARDPHITLMDLGGVASWGNDRHMLTDQFAMHHQRVLDLFNEAHGFHGRGRTKARRCCVRRRVTSRAAAMRLLKPKPLISEPDTLLHFDRALELAVRPSLKEIDAPRQARVEGSAAGPGTSDHRLRARARPGATGADARGHRQAAHRTTTSRARTSRPRAGCWSASRTTCAATSTRRSARRPRGCPEIPPSVVASYILDPTP